MSHALVKPKIKTREKGKDDWKKLRKALELTGHSYVTIGVHDDSGKYDGPHSPEVSTVACWLEFGTERMRARPFLRLAIDTNEKLIESWQREGLERIAFNGWTVFKALDMLGTRVRELVKAQLIHSDYPLDEYNQAYLAFKRRNGIRGTNPLILTQTLLDSIQHVVWLDGERVESGEGAKTHAEKHTGGGRGRDARGRFTKGSH